MKEEKAREKQKKKEHIQATEASMILLIDFVKTQEKKNEELENKIRDLGLIVYELVKRENTFSPTKHLEMDEIK